MKPFQTYIFELSKPAEFRIKVAGVEPKGEVMDRIKNALEAYQLESISAVKSLPIQEHREFPQWGGPCEAYQFDIKLAYPSTALAVKQVIRERAMINPDWINVRNLNEANFTDEAEAAGKDHTGALLDETELKASTEGQALVGQSRIGSLIAELEKHTRVYEVAGTDTNTDKVREPSSKKGETTNNAKKVPMGTTSPEGTKQNKIPDPTKG
jgi:hypothetical protein